MAARYLTATMKTLIKLWYDRDQYDAGFRIKNIANTYNRCSFYCLLVSFTVSFCKAELVHFLIATPAL